MTSGLRRAMITVAACVAIAPVLPGAMALGAQPRAPVIQERVALDASQPVGFQVIVVPDTVYVGQQATYEMGVFITESAQQRMRRNPEVVPAELRGVLAYDLGGPQSLTPQVRGGVRIFPHVLQRALFPLTNGPITIPASQLSYSLPRSSSYFSREEAATVRAGEATLQVKPLPAAGQPADFSGAVGVLTLRSQLDVARARVGDPVVLTLRVGGRGNVKLWPRPLLRAPNASLVPTGERVRVDTTGQYVRGTKEFDWLVTPEREGRLVIPVVDYPYFDPYAEQYLVATSDSLSLQVGAGEFTPTDLDAAAPAVLAIRRDDRGPLPVPLVERPVAWALAGALPIPALWWRRRRVRRARSGGGAGRTPSRFGQMEGDGVEHREAIDVADTLHGPAPDPVRVAASSLRRQLLESLAAQLDTTATHLVERRVLERRLRRRGVTRETTARVMSLLDDLDAAAWSPPGRARDAQAGGDGTWTDRIRAASALVADEAMPPQDSGGRAVARGGGPRAGGRGASRGRLPAWLLVVTGTGVAALLAGGAGVVHARTAQFAEGVALYDSGDYARASATFFREAAAEPRNADAWANAGTAAWAAGDTVQSVIGWQRALRLEPTAVELRVRLDLVGAGATTGVAAVPATPVDAPVWLALGFWAAGWIGLAFGPGLSALLLVGTVGAAGWHVRLAPTRDASALAVIARPEPVRVAPGTDANAAGGTVRGDVVVRGVTRVDGAQGNVWVAVTHADGRTGWLPESALRPLEAP